MELYEILSKVSNLKKYAGYYTGKCPSHNDHNNSLALGENEHKIWVRCFAGCTYEQICKGFGIKPAALYKNGYKHKHEILLRPELAAYKALSDSFLADLGVLQGKNGVLIQYFQLDGTPALRHRMRTRLIASEPNSSYWTGQRGEIVLIYGIWKLADAQALGYLVLVEGETDTWTLWFHGFPCLGIPGATMTSKLQLQYLQDIPKIFIVKEPDRGGETFVLGLRQRLSAIGYQGQSFLITMPPNIKDPSELHKQNPDLFKNAFQNLMQQATNMKEEKPPKTNASNPKIPKRQLKFLQQKAKNQPQPPPFTLIFKTILASPNKSYIVAQEGIFEQNLVQDPLTDESFVTYQKICDDPLLICERYEDIAGEECYVKIVWHDKEKIVSQDMLCHKNFDKLVKFGLRILPYNTKAINEYLWYALGQVPHTKEFSTRNGWRKGEFICGNKVISQTGQHREIARREDIVIGTSGEDLIWCQTVIPFTKDPQIQIACGASACSPLMQMLRVESCSLHFYQDSSVGKSFAAKLAASFWGQFENIVKSWFGTVVGHEMYFHVMKNLPCFLDESQLASKDEIVAQTIYQFANGYGKTRAEMSSGEVVLQGGRNWHTFLISTGEKKVTEVSTYGGLSARVIELYRRPVETISESTFTKTYQKLAQHYGWGGLKIIQYVTAHKEKLVEKYGAILEDLEQSVPIQSNIQKRLLPRWAAIILGSQINQMLFEFEYNPKAIFDELIRSLGEMENEKPSRNLYEAIMEMYQANKKRFHHKDRKGAFQETNESEVWGFCDQGKDTIFFFPRILRRELRKHGFAWSMLAVLKEQGKILHDGKSFQTMARILGQNLRFIAVVITEEKA